MLLSAVLTGKERLGRKWMDEQRIDNCKVPIDKRVERIWQREGLKVPHKQPKRSGLWLADGSCIRLRPEQRNHVRWYDFVDGDQRQVRSRTPNQFLALSQRGALRSRPARFG